VICSILWWGATDGAVGSHLTAFCAQVHGPYGNFGIPTAQSIGTAGKDGQALSGRPVGRSHRPRGQGTSLNCVGTVQDAPEGRGPLNVPCSCRTALTLVPEARGR
jgi:hypothetical protein